jgi:hypothetical protein
MGSPFAQKVVTLFPITEPQLELLCRLQRRVLSLGGVSSDDMLPLMDAFELDARKLSKSDASTRIDVAIAAVRELENYQRSQVRVGNTDEDIDGFWELTDGRIVKVQIAVHGSGKPYGKVLNTDTGKFVFDDRVIHEVRKDGTRLTLDRAKDLGHLYGICVRCGITLTREDSIAAGIGPYCAKKF